MTTEEKAKAYDEALERAKEMIKAMTNIGGVAKVDDIQYLFPELAESEDERIRKALIEGVRQIRCKNDITQEQMIAYLEKQKEQKPVVTHGETYHVDTLGTQQVIAGKMQQKPAEWNEEDEKMRQSIIKDFRAGKVSTIGQEQWLKSLRPQPQIEWDNHDKAIVNCIICCLDGQFVSEAARKQALEWFNKHRRDFLNSPSWKPSNEQMEALGRAIIRVHPSDVVPVLAELRNELQKLM